MKKSCTLANLESISALAALSLAASQANAAVIISYQEEPGGVRVTTSGSLDLSLLTPLGPPEPIMAPPNGTFNTSPASSLVLAGNDSMVPYGDFLTATGFTFAFGPGGAPFSPEDNTLPFSIGVALGLIGDGGVGIIGSPGRPIDGPSQPIGPGGFDVQNADLLIDSTYTSGASFDGSALIEGVNLLDLNLIPNSFAEFVFVGPPPQGGPPLVLAGESVTFTVGPSAIPEPSSVLALGGLLLAGFMRRKR